MGGMHRRIMEGRRAIHRGQQFSRVVQCPETPGGREVFQARRFRAGLNQPRRKPAGHAADRHKCTLQPEADDDARRVLIDETRDYVAAFDDAAEKSSSKKELIERVTAKYGDRPFP